MTKICILAGNKLEAQRYADAQNLEPNQWFYPDNANGLLFQSNFHVIVVGSAGQNVPPALFEAIYDLARKRGKIGRI